MNAGIETVDFDAAEVQRIRDALADTNRNLGQDGRFSLELYDQMLGYIDEYRQMQATVSEEAAE